MNDQHRQNTEDLIRRVFSEFENNINLNLEVADRLLQLAGQCEDLYIEPLSGTLFRIRIDQNREFDVALSHGVWAFRNILARIATICEEVSKRNTLKGKMQSLLIRTGVVADQKMIEQKNPEIKYISAQIDEKHGGSLYGVDATLVLEMTDGLRKELLIRTANTPQKIFLHVKNS
jgi:hypothetical protein